MQFQKGISLNEFLSLYGTDDQSRGAGLLQSMLAPVDGFRSGGLFAEWPNGFDVPALAPDGHDRCCRPNSTAASSSKSVDRCEQPRRTAQEFTFHALEDLIAKRPGSKSINVLAQPCERTR